MYKCLHECAPPYLAELITASTRHDLCFESVVTNSAIGYRAFSVCGPRLWNALPISIRSIENLDRFKSQLKHYFFSSLDSYLTHLNRYRH